MAMRTKLESLGVDVAKDWLDIFNGEEVVRVDNNIKIIRIYLKSLPQSIPIAVEATNVFHELFVRLALAAGHRVYLVDAYRVSRYREAVGVRVKTDDVDARLLFRYLNAEMDHLRPYQPPPKAVKRLMTLLRVRAKLTHSKTALKQSLAGVGELAQTSKALLRHIDQAVKLINNKLVDCINQSGYIDDYRRCQTINGIGPINAAALVAFYHRGEFRKADSFVSFMGLDVRVRESGKFKGKRKLTKKGNPEIRRLLFNAARAGARTAQWKPYYDSLLGRGLTTTAAAVAVARKIAKLAFALMRDQTEYQGKMAQ
jgi:transposase